MNKTPVVTLTILAFAATVGCAELGNFFVPPHPNSDFGDPSKACLYLKGPAVTKRPKPDEKGEKALPAIAGIAASAAIGYLVDRTASAIKNESNRYQSSYSARHTKNLVYIQGDQEKETAYLWNTLTFVRYLGDITRTKTCEELESLPTEQGQEKAFELVAMLITEPTPEIKVNSVTLHKTKAKVASLKWYIPWSWWMTFDRSSQKVDLKATVTLSTIIHKGKGRESKDIISADLPLGKHKLTDAVQQLTVTDVTSGPFVLPNPECGYGCEDLRTTATITVTESNELGDVIGDASKKLTDNKQSINNFILEHLKIETPKNNK